MKSDTMTDHEMLRRYVEEGQEPAFRSLVERHLNLVYGTAFRQVRDPVMAQEIAQNVFLVLAQKAAFFLPGDLGGWLHKTTIFKAKERLREETRRRQRETLAFELNTTMETGATPPHPLSHELDTALLELRDKDRRALLLRFFEEKSLAEVGVALGVSEDTAQKRVAKALDALAQVFRRRGHAIPTTLVIVTALRAGVQAAPASLLSQITTQALLAPTALGSAAGASLIFTKIMSLTKTQIAALCVLTATVPIAYQWQTSHKLAAETRSLESQLADVQQRLADVRQRNLTGSSTSAPSVAGANGLVRPVPRASVDPFVWSADTEFVHVPKSLLPKISLPALGDDGLMTADMARALGVDDTQVRQVNTALSQFYQRYHALENAHTQPTAEHPTSMHITPTAEQISFVRSDFTEEYTPVVAELKTAIDQVLGAANSEYFWNNTDDSPALSEREAATAMRTTLFRPGGEETVDSPYYVGQEFQSADGSWHSGSIRPVHSPDELKLSQLRAVMEKWRREFVAQ